MIIFTCECLLDHLIKMTEEETLNYVMNHEIFSLSDSWLMFIQSGNNILFFCIRALNIIRPFVNERLFCLKRSYFWDDTCLEFVQFSGIHNCCQNCLQLITSNLKKNLIMVKK